MSALETVHILILRPHRATVVQRLRNADTGATVRSYIWMLRPVHDGTAHPERLICSDEARLHFCASAGVSKHDDETGPLACKQMDVILNISCVLW